MKNYNILIIDYTSIIEKINDMRDKLSEYYIDCKCSAIK